MTKDGQAIRMIQTTYFCIHISTWIWCYISMDYCFSYRYDDSLSFQSYNMVLGFKIVWCGGFGSHNDWSISPTYN